MPSPRGGKCGAIDAAVPALQEHALAEALHDARVEAPAAGNPLRRAYGGEQPARAGSALRGTAVGPWQPDGGWLPDSAPQRHRARQ